MHFSIPETFDQKDVKGNTFTNYVIHINGVFHCAVRYRQLYSLHEQLRRDFHPSTLPTFPSKKILPLTLTQIEDRRFQIEKYLQLISQDQRIANSITFNGFLLAAQQETRSERTEEVNLDIFLMNDHKITIRGLTILQTEDVLERVCKQIGVPDELVYYFALYLIRREDTGDMSIVRKLQDFESPYISQRTLQSGTLKLVLRKGCWDPDIDLDLFDHRVTLNLLYIQTVSDVERGWIQASAETKKQLASMQARGAKREYMEMARTLRYYGYVHFQSCICDYPVTNTTAQIAIGNRELILRVRNNQGEVKEGSFKVTKMRCWRIMTLTNPQFSTENGDEPEEELQTKLELSFEYLMNNQQLQWVTVISSQAILMSLCLQSIVEELLRRKNGMSIKKAGEKSCTIEYRFLKKDGSIQTIPIRSGLHARSASCEVNNHGKDQPNNGVTVGRLYSVKKLSERFDVVNMKQASQAAEDVFVENEAFMEIQDGDL